VIKTTTVIDTGSDSGGGGGGVVTNHAPLAGAAAHLAATVEDGGPAGATVASLFGHSFDDSADAGSGINTLAGVALSGNAATAAQGTWQYSADAGDHWIDIGAGISDASALVVKSADLLRFLPTVNWHGTPGDLSARLIDGSTSVVTGGSADVSSHGGSSAYSQATVALSTSVASNQYALVFNGTTSQMATVSAPAASFSALTVEVWVQTTKSSGTMGLVDGYTYNYNYLTQDFDARSGYKLEMINGVPRFSVGQGVAGSGKWISAGTDIADGIWHQLAGVYSGSQIKIYVDGTLEGTGQTNYGTSTTITTSATLTVGDDHDPYWGTPSVTSVNGLTTDDRRFSGSLADLSLWTVERAETGADSLASDMSHRLLGTETGLAGFWKMNDVTGGVVADAKAGSTNAGTVTNTTLASQDTLAATPGTTSYKGVVIGYDPEGDPLTYTVSTMPGHGTVSLGTNPTTTDPIPPNAFVYTPNNVGTPQADAFTVTLSDGTHQTTHTVSVS
jgi:hypothetical protein